MRELLHNSLSPTFATALALAAVCVAADVTAQAGGNHPQRMFVPELGNAAVYVRGDRVTTIGGTPLSFGESAEQSAQAFLNLHAGVLGAALADLEPVSRLRDGRHTQPVMPRRDTGVSTALDKDGYPARLKPEDYKFTLLYYSQFRDGIPVFRGEVRLLVRNEPGYPLVLVKNALRDLGDFHPAAVAGPLAFGAVEDGIRAEFPELVNLTDPDLVIWAGAGNERVEPRLAVTYVADNGAPATATYQKWLFVSDAMTGEVLHRESMIQYSDVTGTVKCYATEDHTSDYCAEEALTPLPYARVRVGTTPYFADSAGAFTISDPGSQVTVTSHLFGRWFYVNNEGGSNSTLNLTANPPSEINFIHNLSQTEFTNAEVNAYVSAHIVRELVLNANPSFPIIGNDGQSGPEEGFRLSVNVDLPCNAYYDGVAVTFFRAAAYGGLYCNNFAFGDVVYHEYGHHVVDEGMLGGAGGYQGEYGEAFGDLMVHLITGRPQEALGAFQTSCADYIRSADNECVYYPDRCSECASGQTPRGNPPICYCNENEDQICQTCEGAINIHLCGTILTGAVWQTRQQLILTEPSWQTVLRDLVINSVLVHDDSSITPEITLDFWTLDDDNAEVSDGTPHFTELYCGFANHRLIPSGFRKGDMTCDDAMDGADVTPFFDAIQDPQNFTGCNLINADINGDGAIDGGDITPFYDCLGSGGNCCPCLRGCYFLE